MGREGGRFLVTQTMVVPQNGWFSMGKFHEKGWYKGYPYFRKPHTHTCVCTYTYIYIYICIYLYILHVAPQAYTMVVKHRFEVGPPSWVPWHDLHRSNSIRQLMKKLMQFLPTQKSFWLFKIRIFFFALKQSKTWKTTTNFPGSIAIPPNLLARSPGGQTVQLFSPAASTKGQTCRWGLV